MSKSIFLGTAGERGSPFSIQNAEKSFISSDSFRNKIGLTIPLEQSMGRTILDAELPPNISKRCMIDIFLDLQDRTAVGFTNISSAKTLLQVSWGAGGSSESTQFTIRDPGHYRLSVIGSWFRVSVINQHIYTSIPNAQLSASITLGETPDDEWGLYVGIIDLKYADIATPSRTTHAAYLADGNGYSTGNIGNATLQLKNSIGGDIAGVYYYDIIPKYARSFRILMESMSQFNIDGFGPSVGAGEYMPWLPVQQKFFINTQPFTIETYQIGFSYGPKGLVFVRF